MLTLDVRSRKPIYEQLIEKIKDMIMHEIFQQDEKLPSVRQLAGELAINPNTIQKAYRELEREGFIYTLPGKGNFVNKQAKSVNEQKVEELKNELMRLITEALYLGITKQEIDELAQTAANNMKGEKTDDRTT